MSEKISTFCERLKEAMDARNIRQADLVNLTNISKGVINSYVKGRYEPKEEKLTAIAAALNVSETWLCGYDVPMSETENAPSYAVTHNKVRKIPQKTADNARTLLEIFYNLSFEGQILLLAEAVKLSRQEAEQNPKGGISNGDNKLG